MSQAADIVESVDERQIALPAQRIIDLCELVDAAAGELETAKLAPALVEVLRSAVAEVRCHASVLV